MEHEQTSKRGKWIGRTEKVLKGKKTRRGVKPCDFSDLKCISRVVASEATSQKPHIENALEQALSKGIRPKTVKEMLRAVVYLESLEELKTVKPKDSAKFSEGKVHKIADGVTEKAEELNIISASEEESGGALDDDYIEGNDGIETSEGNVDYTDERGKPLTPLEELINKFSDLTSSLRDTFPFNLLSKSLPNKLEEFATHLSNYLKYIAERQEGKTFSSKEGGNEDVHNKVDNGNRVEEEDEFEEDESEEDAGDEDTDIYNDEIKKLSLDVSDTEEFKLYKLIYSETVWLERWADYLSLNGDLETLKKGDNLLNRFDIPNLLDIHEAFMHFDFVDHISAHVYGQLRALEFIEEFGLSFWKEQPREATNYYFERLLEFTNELDKSRDLYSQDIALAGLGFVQLFTKLFFSQDKYEMDYLEVAKPYIFFSVAVPLAYFEAAGKAFTARDKPEIISLFRHDYMSVLKLTHAVAGITEKDHFFESFAKLFVKLYWEEDFSNAMNLVLGSSWGCARGNCRREFLLFKIGEKLYRLPDEALTEEFIDPIYYLITLLEELSSASCREYANENMRTSLYELIDDIWGANEYNPYAGYDDYDDFGEDNENDDGGDKGNSKGGNSRGKGGSKRGRSPT